MTYSVLVLSSAERELEKLSMRDVTRVLARIDRLAVEPRQAGTQKLRGTKDCYRVRQGRYRILYRIREKSKKVLIYAIGDRKDVYR